MAITAAERTARSRIAIHTRFAKHNAGEHERHERQAAIARAELARLRAERKVADAAAAAEEAARLAAMVSA